ncbi:MAG TPA: DUF58 domain-containing protein [Candidatus Lumbricidophila sp.]|nr:DUF58 domain-containing protein [Candidatus Lumbricidophila sp.]
MPRLTPRGILVLAGGAVVGVNAFLAGFRDLALLGIGASLIVLVAYLSVWSRRVQVQVSRSLDRVAGVAGGHVTVSLEVRNLGDRALTGARWRDLGDAVAPTETRVLPPIDGIEQAHARTSVRVHYESLPLQRGHWDVGPFELVLEDPFGLARSARRVGAITTLLVVPPVTMLGDSEVSSVGGDGAHLGRSLRRAPSVDQVVVREYRRGDPLGRVNWRATARRGELMVRDEDVIGHQDAYLLLGRRAGQWSQDEVPGVPSPYELAVETIASIGVHLLDHGYTVSVEAQDAPNGHSGAASTYHQQQGPHSLLVALAMVPRLGAPVRTRRMTSLGPNRGGQRPDGIVVLLAATASEVDALVAMRHRFGAATVIALPTLRGQLLDHLSDAGWQVARISSRDDLANLRLYEPGDRPGRSRSPERTGKARS